MQYHERPVIHVVGAGLAGSECALQLAHANFRVILYEMRPEQMTEAHKTHLFAELVCSNSFGSMNDSSAPGQLKWEAHQCGSFILKSAFDHQIPAGQALGIDREKFSSHITQMIESHPLITIEKKQVNDLKEIGRPAVIATGPLTAKNFSESLSNHFGRDFLYFFDAIAPIVDFDSIDSSIAWKADRYDKGTPDYWNCPLDKDQYLHFINEVTLAQKITPKHFEETPFFEGCMPIEEMIERGPQTLRFGPMKPVGLKNPKTGREPYAVVQLRQENSFGTSFNLVGFQTRMTYSEQARVFRMIPGLENAHFLKLGSMHRNLFINTPLVLNLDLSSSLDENLYFAGQITGVEGYFESTVIGLIVAQNIIRKYSMSKKSNQAISSEIPAYSLPPATTAVGSLLTAITDKTRGQNFQPTNINFGLFQPLLNSYLEEIFPRNKYGKLLIDKEQKKKLLIERARKDFTEWITKERKTILNS